MKRVRVYQQILSEDNLRLAIREVNRGHRRNGDHSLNKKVLEIEANMDEYVAELRRFIEDLVSGAGTGTRTAERANGGTSTSRFCGRTSMSTMRCYSP